jgi:hypothetical protein
VHRVGREIMNNEEYKQDEFEVEFEYRDPSLSVIVRDL